MARKLPPFFTMNINYGTVLLRHIVQQMNAGRPLWALLILNEYSEGNDDPLLSALRRKGREQLSKSEVSPAIRKYYQEICLGKKLGDFSSEAQDILKRHQEKYLGPRRRFIPRERFSTPSSLKSKQTVKLS